MTTFHSWRAGACLLVASLYALSTNAQDPGFFLNDWEERTAEIPLHQNIDKTKNEASFNISIDYNDVLSKVPIYIFGHNYATWDNKNGLMENPTGNKDVKNLNPHAIRWPGGSLSDNYFWNAPYGVRPSDIPSSISPWYGPSDNSWETSLNDYYDMLQQTNSTGVITVNYGYARYGTGPNPVQKAAHLAADWVRHDNGRTKFWEIGNENFGSWESGYEIDLSKNQDGQPQYITGKLYGQHCRVFIDSMRAAAAEIGTEIKIGVVAFDAETSWTARESNWNEEMMPEVGHLADFLSVHSYFTPYDTDSPPGVILNSYTVPEEIMTVLKNDMAESGQTMLPVAMTEWNIFATGSMQQVSHINGMLATMVLGELIKNEYGMGNRWDFINGWSDGNTHALFSTGGEPGVDPFNPRAPFYYMYFFQKYFGDRMLGLSHNGGNDIVAYASNFTSGEVGIAMVNKSNAAKTTLVEIANFEPGVRYYTMTLTGDNATFSRKVYLNGVGTDEEGGGPDNYKTVKAFAAEVDGGILADLPPLSTVYLLVDKKGPLSYVKSQIDTSAQVISVKLSEEVKLAADPSGFDVVINETSSVAISSITVDESDAKWIHIYLDQELTFKDLISLSYSGNDVLSIDDVALAAFTDETVTNMLPGDPVNVTFKVRNTQSEALIEECKLNFNAEEKFTNENGEAVFSVRPGEFNISATKMHLDSIDAEPMVILSDTTIALFLDSTTYNIHLLIENQMTGSALPFTIIEAGSNTEQTGSDGSAIIQTFAGSQLFSFEKLNYTSKSEEFLITSDTSLLVTLVQSHAKLKITLKYEDQPVQNALFVLDEDTLYTNLVGVCTFESVLLNTNFDYYAFKDNYYPLSGNLNVSADTNIVFQMSKSVASLQLNITSASGDILNAFAVIDSDTVLFNNEGMGRFYNLPLNMQYSYLIKGDNFSPVRGDIFLERDTTIFVTLIVGIDRNVSDDTSIQIYPNPASEFVTIFSDNLPVEYVEIIETTGKVIHKELFAIPLERVHINLDSPAGMYILNIKTKNNIYRSVLLVQ